MLSLLSKVFIRQFYSSNAGFFLFFFFVFFGAVEGGQLLTYHLSIMHSMLGSGAVLLLVFACWLLYHLKCVGFALKTIDQPQCSFLYNLQAADSAKQWVCCLVVYAGLYAPVLFYAVLVAIVGFREGQMYSALWILTFLFGTLFVFTAALRYRLTNWLYRFRLPSITGGTRKKFPLFILFHFLNSRKKWLLALKSFSLLLLYTILVWNKGRYDNDSFLLFYLVILAAHAVVPFAAVQFMENDLLFSRNLPIPLFSRMLAFLFPYILVLLPETAYILLQADGLPVNHRVAYVVNFAASLFLLTAIQYSEAVSRDEYLKATFAVVLISIFVLHAQAFWFWIGAQLLMAIILFASGYKNFERSLNE